MGIGGDVGADEVFPVEEADGDEEVSTRSGADGVGTVCSRERCSGDEVVNPGGEGACRNGMLRRG